MPLRVADTARCHIAKGCRARRLAIGTGFTGTRLRGRPPRSSRTTSLLSSGGRSGSSLCRAAAHDPAVAGGAASVSSVWLRQPYGRAAMARGHQKIQSQQKNAKKQAEAKKSKGHDQKTAAKAALVFTCGVCRSQMPDPKTFKQHFESKHPKSPLPPELVGVEA